jgi:predicted nucleic acid-binding protein
VRLHLTEATLARAESLAWEHGLRGYDAAHLACAFQWQESIGERVTLATFDRQLSDAGRRAGMFTWPRLA